jgi:hypothetical protein
LSERLALLLFPTPSFPKGPNTTMLDEMERAMHDALCAVARTLESGHVVAGGGAVEVRKREQEKEDESLLPFAKDGSEHLH